MVDEWTRGDGFIVSFKVRFRYDSTSKISHSPILQLETDESLLIPKARAALERYGHQVVIGNDLHRRKYEVVFVSRKALPPLPPDAKPEAGAGDNAKDVTGSHSTFVESWLRIDIPPSSSTHQVKEIEEDIVDELVRRHTRWIEGQQ